MRSFKTRRITAIILAVCLAIAMVPSFAFAETGIVKTCDEALYTPIKVYLNGEPIYFDADPEIINGRTMVPMRGIFEAFGMDVNWYPSDKSITAERDTSYGFQIVWMQIGCSYIQVNEETYYLDDSPAPYVQIYSGRTLIPLRVLSEALNMGVYWDDYERAVYLSSNDAYSLG